MIHCRYIKSKVSSLLLLLHERRNKSPFAEKKRTIARCELQCVLSRIKCSTK